jgi:ribosomal protein L33
MPTKFCPHCGKRTGFQVKFNIVCRIGDEEEKGYLRTCQECGGRFITIQKDERIKEELYKRELNTHNITKLAT